MSGITLHPDHITVRAKLLSRGDIDWAIKSLTAARDTLFPAETLFDVVFLSHHPEKKIHAIKEIRNATGLGLKEAKDASEMPGSVILRGCPQSMGRRLIQALADVSASAELRPHL